MTLFHPFNRSKPDNTKPAKIREPQFTQGHRLTLGFVVELLATLRHMQHDYHIDDVLELHVGHLTEILAHVIDHLKHASEQPDNVHDKQ